MSIKIPLFEISQQDADKISKDLEFTPITTKYNENKPPNSIYPYETRDEFLKIPLYYGVTSMNYKRPERNTFSPSKTEFVGILRNYQEVVAKKSIKFLNKTGSVMLALYPGWGKTMLAIYLSCCIGLKTLIIVNKIVLINQWKESIIKFCPKAKIQIISPKSKLDKDSNFYIINCLNIPKLGFEFYKDMGLLIADEIHLLATEILSKSFLYITPRYTIGLSATPTRPDGMHSLLEAYYGPPKIIEKLYRKHNVYKLKTEFEIDFKLGKNGKVDWNSVLESQCNNIERNELIIRIVKKFKERYFLILCKRVNQANFLIKRLAEENQDVTSLVGKQQEYDGNARILVAIVQKCGTGFNHPKLNTLLMASDTEEYFVQYLGRVFRTEESDPIIFDIVDNFGILHSHFATRKSVYLECGGIIKNIEVSKLLS